MSEHDFISLGIPVGTSRLTISATSVAALNSFLNDLNEEDPLEGMSPVGDILDHINTINAAVNLKMPGMAYDPNRPANTSAGNSAPATPPAAAAPSCKHGVMTFRSGTTKSGPNAGKPYKAYFCPAPRGTDQCKPEFVND